MPRRSCWSSISRWSARRALSRSQSPGFSVSRTPASSPRPSITESAPSCSGGNVAVAAVHDDGGDAGRPRRLDIGRAVADHDGVPRLHAKLLHGRQQHVRSRLLGDAGIAADHRTEQRRHAEMIENRLDEPLRLVGDEAEQDSVAVKSVEHIERRRASAPSIRSDGLRRRRPSPSARAERRAPARHRSPRRRVPPASRHHCRSST